MRRTASALLRPGAVLLVVAGPFIASKISGHEAGAWTVGGMALYAIVARIDRARLARDVRHLRDVGLRCWESLVITAHEYDADRARRRRW